MVNAIKRINSPPTKTSAAPPSSDPVPGDQAEPSVDTEGLTVVVNVLEKQLKCALRVQGPSVLE